MSWTFAAEECGGEDFEAVKADVDSGETEEVGAYPNQILVHIVLMAGQAINGCGTVIGKVGLSNANPVLFALVREGCACPFFLFIAWYFEGRKGRIPSIGRRETFWVVLAGCSLFMNQLMYITGVKLANSVIGSAWQPSQPIFVMLICVFLQWEKLTWPKGLGILCALGGGAVMVALDKSASGKTGSYVLAGNLMFFGNCVGTALYVIFCRVLLQYLPPFTVVAGAYLVATLGIALSLFGVNHSDASLKFVCPDGCPAWTVPGSEVGAIAFYILGPSVLCYCFLAWGTRNAKVTTYCLAYTALQPVSSLLLSLIFIAAGWNDSHPDNKLSIPGWNGLGALGVLAGVALVTLDAYLTKVTPIEEANAEPLIH